MALSKSQQQIQEAFIRKEKARINRKRSERGAFRYNAVKECFDPLSIITRPSKL